MPQPLYTFAAALSWPVVRGALRLRARGLENLPAGGFVLAANHQSNFDPWPLAMPLFPRRQLRFMAKSELFNPLLGPLITAGGAFPVHRGQGDLEALETAVRLIHEGEIVVMFPEGTRRSKGMRKKHRPRPHTGAARIALEAEAPLVPAAIKGTDRLSRLGPLRVAYGPPVQTDDLGDVEIKRGSRTATERLMAAIGELEGTL
jgi:1-acyl-sn-glycerol-3-phosphate acyltransferase